MAQGLYYKAGIETSPDEVINQNGDLWQISHRESAISDNGSLDLMIDVALSARVNINFSSDGLFQGTFNSVGSQWQSSETNLGPFLSNEFFQASKVGFQTTLFSHTGSYAVLNKRWDFLVPGNGIHKSIGELILAPGKYMFAMQNISGGAAALNFNAVWDEPTVPNAP